MLTGKYRWSESKLIDFLDNMHVKFVELFLLCENPSILFEIYKAMHIDEYKLH
jgi:hypothetical protein